MPFERVKATYRSLRFRLTVWNTAVVLLAVLASLFAVRAGVRAALLRETDRYLLDDTAEVGLAVREFHPDLDRIREEINRKAAGHVHRSLFVQLLDDRGAVVCASPHIPPLRPPAFRKGQTALASVAGYRLAQRTLRLPRGWAVRVGESLRAVEGDVARLTNTMLVVALITVLLSPLGGYWLAGRATLPLARINRLAAELRPSKLDERLPVRGAGDELDRMSQTINGLLDRIAAYLDQNRQFTASAAHELRSPLAAIQSSVEVALNADRSSAEYQELLDEIAEECGNLRLLVNQLLLLAESDAGQPKTAFASVDLDRIVARSVEMFRDAAEEQGIHLEVTALERLRVCGNQNGLRQVVNNLIDNGIKFNRPGGRVAVELRAEQERGGVRLQVSDTGGGIPLDDLPQIFERFFRGDKSRQRENASHGNGLGLSICRAIVEAHSGNIEVASTPGQGTTFRVHLPAL